MKSRFLLTRVGDSCFFQALDRVWSREISEGFERGEIVEAFETGTVVILDEAVEELIAIQVGAE